MIAICTAYKGLQKKNSWLKERTKKWFKLLVFSQDNVCRGFLFTTCSAWLRTPKLNSINWVSPSQGSTTILTTAQLWKEFPSSKTLVAFRCSLSPTETLSTSLACCRRISTLFGERKMVSLQLYRTPESFTLGQCWRAAIFLRVQIRNWVKILKGSAFTAPARKTTSISVLTTTAATPPFSCSSKISPNVSELFLKVRVQAFGEEKTNKRKWSLTQICLLALRDRKTLRSILKLSTAFTNLRFWSSKCIRILWMKVRARP